MPKRQISCRKCVGEAGPNCLSLTGQDAVPEPALQTFAAGAKSSAIRIGSLRDEADLMFASSNVSLRPFGLTGYTGFVHERSAHLCAIREIGCSIE